jgi:hypothetical protein
MKPSIFNKYAMGSILNQACSEDRFASMAGKEALADLHTSQHGSHKNKGFEMSRTKGN